MGHIGSPAAMMGATGPSSADRPPAMTSRRTPVHVHATPASAVAELDGRCRRWTEWLMTARRAGGVPVPDARPPATPGAASRGEGAHP